MNDIFLLWAGVAWLSIVGAFTLIDKRSQHWGAWLTGAMLVVVGIYINYPELMLYVALVLFAVMFVVEICTDDAAFDKGILDRHGLDLVFYFAPGLIAGIMAGQWQVLWLGWALRVWFDLLLNLKRGKGLMHLGTEATWDRFLANFSRWQQIIIRVVLSALLVSLWWWWDLLVVIVRLTWEKLF